MRLKTIVLVLLLPTLLLANEKQKVSAYQGFSGGMMLHTGYLWGKSYAPRENNWHGATFGIGGALRVNLWNHLRVGGEGFVSTMPSTLSNQAHTLEQGSYVRNGWGGLIVDACWRQNNKIWPYIGGSIGGGSCKSLYLYDGKQTDWLPEHDVIYNKEAYWYVNPYVAMDYCMTEKVHLTLRLDWLMAFAPSPLNPEATSNHALHLLLPSGPRLYFGFMFCH